MIIYNTTFQVDDNTTTEFIDWIRTQYVPQALATGIVSRPQLARIMGRHEGGTGYALQLQAATLGELQNWYRTTGKDLMTRFNTRFGTRAVNFSTMMETVEL